MIDESRIEYLRDGERAEADVLNRPIRHLVSATNESLSEVRDAIGTSLDDAALLIEEKYDEIFEVTNDGSGFTRERDARLIFDADNATVSIAPGLGKDTWFYYHKGRKIESSEPLTYTLSEADKTNGGFYLSFNEYGELVNTGPYPDFHNTTLCFYVHYSNGEFIIEGDERHSVDRDTAWHESHHREVGLVVYTLGNIDWTPDDENDVGIQITSTLVADEDLHHVIKHSPTGEEPFSQILEGSQDTVRIPTLYYDGDFRYLADKKLPWVVDALKYNDEDTLEDVPDGKFVNYFLVATNCQKYPIKLIMGKMLFDSDHETVDETLESLGLNFPEIALLYKISLERDNSLSTVGKCKLTSIRKAASGVSFVGNAGSSGSGGNLSYHAQLLGRNDDNAHPMSSITGLQEALSDINSASTDALATKADKTIRVIAGTGLTGGGNLSTNRTLNVQYGTTAGTAVQGNDPRIAEAFQKSQVTQVTGVSTTSVMSQKAVTDALNTKVNTTTQVIAGTGLTGGGTLADSRTLSVKYGTTAGTAVEGNDPRLANIVNDYTLSALEAALEAKKADKSITITAGTGLSGGGTLAANRSFSVNYGTTAGTAAQGNDSRLSNSREWTAGTISQAEAEAGTATTRRAFTAQRVRQAIVAWWNGITGVFGRDLVSSSSSSVARDKLGLHTSALRWPTFTEVTSKPATATRWPTWAEVSGKPTTFAPASHTHNYLPLSGGSLSGNLSVTGSITASGNVTAFSDIKLKEDIEVITDAISKIDTLHGYTYKRKDIEGDVRHTGVIAQEVQKVLPEAVMEDDDGTLSVAYGNMVGLLIEAIKELKTEVKESKTEVKELMAEVNELKEKLNGN